MATFLISGFTDEIDHSLDVQLEYAKKLKLDCIEIRRIDGVFTENCPTDTVKKARDKLDAAGVGVSAIGSLLGRVDLSEDFEKHLDSFKHAVDLAGILKTRNIRMFSFFIPEGAYFADYRNEVFDRWHRFVEAADGSGIRLCHENETGTYGDTAERCVELMEELDSPWVKMAFDAGNFVLSGEEVYPKAFKALRKHTEYVHIKDAILDLGREVPAGYGEGGVREILKDLIAEDYENYLTLEPKLWSFEGLPGHEGEFDPEKLNGGNAGKFEIAHDALMKLFNELGYQK